MSPDREPTREPWKMTDEQAEAAWEEWRKDAAQPVTRHPVTAMVEAAVRLGIVVPAGARVQVPPVSRELLRGRITEILTKASCVAPPPRIVEELLSLLPRSVQHE